MAEELSDFTEDWEALRELERGSLADGSVMHTLRGSWREGQRSPLPGSQRVPTNVGNHCHTHVALVVRPAQEGCWIRSRLVFLVQAHGMSLFKHPRHNVKRVSWLRSPNRSRSGERPSSRRESPRSTVQDPVRGVSP